MKKERMGTDVLIAGNINIVFLDVTPSSLVDIHRCSGGTCCLHLLGRRVIILFYPVDRENRLL
jgi:hypothetical protein